MEQAKIWRNPAMPGIELLSATYTQFSFAKHWHDELAIGIIEQGAEGVFYRGQNLLVPQQQIIAINPAEVHTGFAGTESGWRYRMFYFDLTLLEELFADAGASKVNPIIERPLIDDPQLFALLLQLHVSLELPSLALTKSTLLAQCMALLFRRYGSNPESDTQCITESAALNARDYLHAHWADNPTLDELEALTDSSKFALIRSFKTLFGVTPHQYLLLLKTQQAKALLQGGMSCVDTALSCGFYDQSHFQRNFKRAYGVTPRSYR